MSSDAFDLDALLGGQGEDDVFDLDAALAGDEFPGMPSPSMRNRAQPWQMPQVGNVDQLAQFQKEQEAQEPQPPPLLARMPGQRDPVDMEKVLRGTLERAGSFGTTPTPEDDRAGWEAGVPGMALTGMTLPLAAAGVGSGVAAMRGLSAVDKARKVAGAAPGILKAGAIGLGAEEAMKAVGIPAGVRLALFAAFGMPRPGLGSAASAVRSAVGAERATVAGSERFAAKVAAAKADEAARKAATAALGKGTPKVLSETEKAVASARPWEAPKPNWTRMGDEAATEAAAIAPKPTVASSAASYQDELKAANEARAARLAQLDKEEAVKAAMAPVKAEPMAAAEERLYNAAESANTRSVIKAETDYLKATESAAKKAATQRAVGDGVKRSSVPKTDDLIDGDFIDPKHVSVVPEPPVPAGPAVPPNYEATVGQTTKVQEMRRKYGAKHTADMLGKPASEVGQIRLDADTITDEALGEVSKLIPSGDQNAGWARIVRDMKALPPDQRAAYIARSNSPKNRAQMEQLRRTLESLGIMIPVGVGVGAASRER